MTFTQAKMPGVFVLSKRFLVCDMKRFAESINEPTKA
jgi:hypothetical protein